MEQPSFSQFLHAAKLLHLIKMKLLKWSQGHCNGTVIFVKNNNCKKVEAHYSEETCLAKIMKKKVKANWYCMIMRASHMPLKNQLHTLS